MDLRLRHRVNELMDQPGLDEQLHRKALRGLRRVNWFSRSSGILWSSIRELAGRVERRPLRVLDIACGGGDVTVAIARRGQRAGIEMQVDGCDISPVAVRHARQQAEQVQPGVGFFELDALADPLPDDYDVLMCSLFLHHLDEADAVELLRRMSVATRHLLLVNDLRRTRWGYWLARWGSRVLTRSQIVHTDGPLSVSAAFTAEETLQLARQAGIDHATLSQHWPQRFLFSWRRR
jgi:SAM-dependent methyltransferase